MEGKRRDGNGYAGQSSVGGGHDSQIFLVNFATFAAPALRFFPARRC